MTLNNEASPSASRSETPAKAVGPGTRLRQAHRAARPLVAPLAHDALSARMIQAAGFPAINIGGSTLLAARYALPDIGLAALGEMAPAIRDVVDAVPDMPCLVDGDDGYGDARQVARTVAVLERIGVGGLILEDQHRLEKQPGATAARQVVPLETMLEKLAVALATRADPELVIIARTDALGAGGMEEALRRGERYLKQGADGVFVAGAKGREQLERVGQAFRGQWNMAALFEQPDGALLTPGELSGLGFSHIVYPMAMMLRVVGAIEQFLTRLRDFAEGRSATLGAPDAGAPECFSRAVKSAEWNELAERIAKHRLR
ncbi:MAG TPA: isocitrate lyase/PEP mutase family protein [Hyphomicrobiaceae bacterium]